MNLSQCLCCDIPSFTTDNRNLFILGDFNRHHPLWTSKGTSDPRVEEIFNWVISSKLLLLNDIHIPTLFLRSFGSCCSPDISFAPSSIALFCFWEVLHDLGSDHLPILLTVPLSPVFHHNERPASFNFQKIRFGMSLLFTSTLIVLLQRNTCFFLFPLLLLCSLF